MDSRHFGELDRIHGEPMEFEFSIFPGFSILEILAEIQKMMTDIKCEPVQFQGCRTTLNGDTKWTEKPVVRKLLWFRSMLWKLRKDIGRFLGPEQKRSGTETHVYKPNGKWDRVAEDMMLNSSESVHPVFRASSAIERGRIEK